MNPTREELREATRNVRGYRIVVTKYNGRSTSVETFGPMSWNEAQRVVREHGANFHAELQSADDDYPKMRVAYGKVSYC